MTTIGSTSPVTGPAPESRPAAVAAKPVASVDNEGNVPYKSAEHMVDFAEKFLDGLASALGYADGGRRSLTPERFEEDKRLFGEDVAKMRRASDEEAIRKWEGMAKADEMALRHVFTVKGDLITRNEDGVRVLGKFTLNGGGGGFAVQIDSEKGASVSKNGGPFTSDFARITPAQLRNLPYLKAIADSLNVQV